jgi:hypothetical protein
MPRKKKSVTFHFLVDLLDQFGELRRGAILMRTTRREDLLGRMKAGLVHLLARRRRNEPLPESQPLPAHHRVFEILGDLNRRSGGPEKGA